MKKMVRGVDQSESTSVKPVRIANMDAFGDKSLYMMMIPVRVSVGDKSELQDSMFHRYMAELDRFFHFDSDAIGDSIKRVDEAYTFDELHKSQYNELVHEAKEFY